MYPVIRIIMLFQYNLCSQFILLQPALDLLSYDEMRGLLSGDLGYGPPSALLLHRHATYEAPLCAEDPHVMVSVCDKKTFTYHV